MLILGASGGTGTVLVTEALAQGHVVTALSRNPATALEAAVRPRVVAGDVLDSRCMQSFVADQDVVIWAVGARAGERAAHVCAVGTKNVLWAMQTAGVRRFICESAFGVGESRRGALCANVLETPTPIEFSVEGGEAEDHGVPEGGGLGGRDGRSP